MARFKADAASAAVLARIDADIREGDTLGVSSAPAFFINGRFLSGARPYGVFKAMVDEELAQKWTRASIPGGR